MHFTKVQISELMRKHAEKENGLHDLMEIMLESMMVAERSEFLHENPQNKGNGYRFGHAYGQGRKLEFRIPRDRYGNFHPQILAILRNQEEECDRLAGVLYTKGLTQEQVGDVFEQIYGQHYSKSSISRMVDSVRTQVNAWLDRSLESYYPVMFVDCVHIKIHRKRSVSSEAFYVALAVTEEGRRDVLGIFNIPTESATGWSDIFDTLKGRGIQKIGLMVADGIKGLDVVVGEKFPGTPLQRCVTISNAICLPRSVMETRVLWLLICVIYSVPDSAITPLRWPGRNGKICVRGGVKTTGHSNSCVTTPIIRHT